jgi:hypothetical protein
VKVGTVQEEGLVMKFDEYDDQLLCVIKAGTLCITQVTYQLFKEGHKKW